MRIDRKEEHRRLYVHLFYKWIQSVEIVLRIPTSRTLTQACANMYKQVCCADIPRLRTHQGRERVSGSLLFKVPRGLLTKKKKDSFSIWWRRSLAICSWLFMREFRESTQDIWCRCKSSLGKRWMRLRQHRPQIPLQSRCVLLWLIEVIWTNPKSPSHQL